MIEVMVDSGKRWQAVEEMVKKHRGRERTGRETNIWMIRSKIHEMVIRANS